MSTVVYGQSLATESSHLGGDGSGNPPPARAAVFGGSGNRYR